MTSLNDALLLRIAEALERMARARNADPDALANEALREWLDESTEIERKVEAAMTDVRAGHVIAHERVKQWVESWGSEREVPRPR